MQTITHNGQEYTETPFPVQCGEYCIYQGMIYKCIGIQRNGITTKKRIENSKDSIWIDSSNNLKAIRDKWGQTTAHISI